MVRNLLRYQQFECSERVAVNKLTHRRKTKISTCKKENTCEVCGASDIPTEFCQLTKLKELRINVILISGTIPTEIGKLILMEKLTLD
mmetsp:Transcript_3845/g.3975  ORF Transcript_3845/g.3975 Transcript_3845/m.3975 type:complete len:88 (+) Transcript_3845:254-517(+)